MAILKTKKDSGRTQGLRKKLREQRPINLLIDAELFKRFKVKAATDGKTMTEVLVDAITDYLR